MDAKLVREKALKVHEKCKEIISLELYNLEYNLYQFIGNSIQCKASNGYFYIELKMEDTLNKAIFSRLYNDEELKGINPDIFFSNKAKELVNAGKKTFIEMANTFEKEGFKTSLEETDDDYVLTIGWGE